MTNLRLELGQCATLACLLEVTAPKPGNVHRAADFDDLKFTDFIASAVAIGPVVGRAGGQGVGDTVLESIRATRKVAASNTNLGTVLLLAPMAAVPRDVPIGDGIESVLRSLTPEDSDLVYEAIRLASAGGLGEVDEMDVGSRAPDDLITAMEAAAGRDLVARQYVSGFSTVVDMVVPTLTACRDKGWTLTHSIVWVQMQLMSQFPDSLIARKCGKDVAAKSASMAARVVECGSVDSPDALRRLSDLDFWLRSDGHRRNPGTTADLIAAGLFVALRENRLQAPFD